MNISDIFLRYLLFFPERYIRSYENKDIPKKLFRKNWMEYLFKSGSFMVFLWPKNHKKEGENKRGDVSDIQTGVDRCSGVDIEAGVQNT